MAIKYATNNEPDPVPNRNVGKLKDYIMTNEPMSLLKTINTWKSCKDHYDRYSDIVVKLPHDPSSALAGRSLSLLDMESWKVRLYWG